MKYILLKEFGTVNWLPIKGRFNQCINYIVFNTLTTKALLISTISFVKGSTELHYSVKLTQVRMPYLSLLPQCRVTSLRKLKE